MEIYGKNMKLRAIRSSDASMLYELINDPDVEYMLGGFSFPKSLESQKKWIETLSDTPGCFRAVIEIGGDAAGVIILTDIDQKNGNAEVHLKLAGHMRGMGAGGEAVNLLTNYCFEELRLMCVYARVSSHNLQSIKMFRKCGYETEGVLRKRLFKRGEFLDVHVLSKLNG